MNPDATNKKPSLLNNLTKSNRNTSQKQEISASILRIRLEMISLKFMICLREQYHRLTEVVRPFH